MVALAVLAICAIVLFVLVLPFRTSRSGRSAEPDVGDDAIVTRKPRAAGAATPDAALTIDPRQLVDEKDRVFQALADLRFDYEAGKVSREDFELENAKLRNQAASLLAELSRRGEA